MNKLELKKCMDRYYCYNETLEKFAFLTGKNRRTFNRDFRDIYKESPDKWLQKKRLEIAYQQITKESKFASDIFVQLGFESLSHFSTTFKREFGYTPFSSYVFFYKDIAS